MRYKIFKFNFERLRSKLLKLRREIIESGNSIYENKEYLEIKKKFLKCCELSRSQIEHSVGFNIMLEDN